MNASLIAIIPTCGCRYQQGLPRRVILLSIISSETKKKACRSSIIQPRVEAWKYSSPESGLSKSRETESGTDIPRLHFPPIVFAFNDWCWSFSWNSAKNELYHTALYQSRAIWGRPYCFACASRSSTRVGNMDSNSLRVVNLAILVSQMELFNKSCEQFWLWIEHEKSAWWGSNWGYFYLESGEENGKARNLKLGRNIRSRQRPSPRSPY